jgi:hypothetical protein
MDLDDGFVLLMLAPSLVSFCDARDCILPYRILEHIVDLRS